MRWLPSILLATLLTGPAGATPTFQLSWDSCTGPLARCIVPGEEVGLYASVTGQDTPHIAYEFRFEVSHLGGIPDAWRFEPTGCEGTVLIHMNYLSSSKSCPTFERANESLHISDYSYDALTGTGRVVMSSSYPQGSPAIDPSKRYMLGQILFNFLFAVNGPGVPGETCGGLEKSMQLSLTRAAWLDQATGNEHAFATGPLTLTANDPAADCIPVPARAVTWGAIRGQYR